MVPFKVQFQIVKYLKWSWFDEKHPTSISDAYFREFVRWMQVFGTCIEWKYDDIKFKIYALHIELYWIVLFLSEMLLNCHLFGG